VRVLEAVEAVAGRRAAIRDHGDRDAEDVEQTWKS
jgi:hypothetical protein